ncbi:MAG: tetratricopeptide repeat protein [bacterium]|nr:tetratricopeptide repeat protein [bacterium]
MRHLVRCALLLLVAGVGTARADLPRDWTRLDGMLDRSRVLHYYLSGINQPDDGYGIYVERLRYEAEVDSIGPEGWAALTAAQQERRRSLARQRVARLDRVRRTMSRLYNSTLGVESAPAAGDGVLLEGGAELVIDALADLIHATGLVPIEPEPWADLAYFAGLVGDTRRQRHAFQAFRALHDALPATTQHSLAFRRARGALDMAWTERDLGQGDRAVALSLEARTWIVRGGLQGHLLSREARLVAGLARAEQGRLEEARELAAPLDDLPFQRRNSISHFFGYAQAAKRAWSGRPATEVLEEALEEPSGEAGTDINDPMAPQRVGGGLTAAHTPNDWSPEPVVQKNAGVSGTSDWARDWVQAFIHLRSMPAEVVLKRIAEPDPMREYPPGLAHRYWNDFGLVYERLGRHADARRCYAAATMYRPYFLYYPLEGRQSRSRLYTGEEEARVYYLGAGRFYTGGDLYAFASGCVLAWEFTDDPDRRDRLRDLAEESLTACRNRGIRPTAALAQRGRLRYLAGDLTRAGTDLETALEEFRAEQRDDAELLLMLGLVHFNAGDFSGAAPWLEDYSRRRPGEVVGWLALGLAAAHMEHLAAAETALSRAVDLRPDDPGSWFNRGLVRIKRGQGEAALADLEQALVLVPGHADILRITELLAAGELPNIALQSSPIVLGTSQPATTASESLQRVHMGAEMRASSVADLLSAGLEEGADRFALEDTHLHDPSPANRALLARRYLADGRPDLVQDLLVPVWDSGLTDEELLVLLAADRELGESERAVALVHGLQGMAPETATAAIWQLVGVTCLEAGLENQADAALKYAESLLKATVPDDR